MSGPRNLGYPYPYALAVCFLLLSSSARTAPAAKEHPGDAFTAEQILERVAKTYAHCKTYLDAGVVETTYIRSLSRQLESKPFMTAFVRPDRFRFEYKARSYSTNKVETSHIVWRDKKNWVAEPEDSKKDPFMMALAGETGVSTGSAHTVPALLLPDEVAGRRITEMTEPERLKDETLGKARCFRIRGLHGGQPATVWIDKRFFLLRRIDQDHDYKDFRTETRTLYQPILDKKIKPEFLEFKPPKKD